jgi:hypothetical protein
MTLLEIRTNRFYYLIPLPFILLLMILFYKHGIKGEHADQVFTVLGFFVLLAGGFLLVYFLKQFITNPYLFKATDKGFEYIPTGVSYGFYNWKDVVSVQDDDGKAIIVTLHAASGAGKIYAGLPDSTGQRNITLEAGPLRGKYQDVLNLFREKTGDHR